MNPLEQDWQKEMRDDPRTTAQLIPYGTFKL